MSRSIAIHSKSRKGFWKCDKCKDSYEFVRVNGRRFCGKCGRQRG